MTGGGGSGGSSGGGSPAPQKPPAEFSLANATTREEIAAYMANKYGWDMSDFLNPEMERPNPSFIPVTPDFESMREFAQAVDDMMTKHPFLRFDTNNPMRVGRLPDAKPSQGWTANAFASMSYVWNPSTGKYQWTGAKSITLSAIGVPEYRERASIIYSRGQRDSRTRDHNPNVIDRPAYYTMIHEMGHIMDFNGKGNSHKRVEDAIDDLYRQSPDFESFKQRFPNSWQQNWQIDRDKWLEQRLVSAYSYKKNDRTQGINTVEAIAEAFLDVEARGEYADPMSKLIYDIVLEEAKKARGVL